jgi:hypothetical protein
MAKLLSCKMITVWLDRAAAVYCLYAYLSSLALKTLHLLFVVHLSNCYGYLWVAEHTTNKIAVIDPETGLSRGVEIPTSNPYAQFLTSDSKGNIWFAEPHGDSLGFITHSP